MSDKVLPARRAFLLTAMLAGSSAAATLLRPKRMLAANAPQVHLETWVPEQFGHWTIDKSVVPIQPSPEVLAKVEKIYDATLARTYINDRGERVMLSLAYGGDQTGRLRVHRPESCYSAQGFHVKRLRTEQLQVDGISVPVKRLHARLASRSEPITYWIRVGDETVTGNIGQRITQLKYGITGDVPDGLIFRMSSIEADPERAFALHDAFVRDLMAAVDRPGAERLVGRHGGQTL